MRLAAPAKINLHLRVGPPRGDGFHPLLSWMCTVGLSDELEFSAGTHGIQLQCDDPAIPTGTDNLIVRAAMALGGQSAKIHLTKRIPMGGGLAGGSSDAATTLLGLNDLWQFHKTPDQLAQIAAKLGSDISFFLHGSSSICSDLGQIVRSIAKPRPRWAMLIIPPFGMATPRVYRRFDEMNLGLPEHIEVEPDFSSWTDMRAMELLPLLVNDLEAPAFDLNPELAALRIEWQEKLGRPIRMSGSGSTLFTLYDHIEEAHADAARAPDASFRIVELAP